MRRLIKIYDTTLRDGMQGQGMSLSAAEKVRVVQALDRLGVHFVEIETQVAAQEQVGTA